MLENDYSTFAWRKLIAKVSDAVGNARDIIKNYKCISLPDCLKCTNIYLGDSTLSDPDSNYILIDLDPANNPNYKIIFYKHIWSKMISQHLQD